MISYEGQLFPATPGRTGTSCLSTALYPSAALDDVQTESQLNLDTGQAGCDKVGVWSMVMVSSPSYLDFCFTYIYIHIHLAI